MGLFRRFNIVSPCRDADENQQRQRTEGVKKFGHKVSP
jgi:hypothetical protein